MATTLRPSVDLSTPPPSPARKGDDLALLGFTLLIVLGMIAAVVSFLRM